MSAISSGSFSVATTGSLRTSIEGLLVGLDSSDSAAVDQLGRRLAEAFFRRSDEVYLLQRRLDAVLAQWCDLYRWVSVRQPGEILVRVFNPTVEANGYGLRRTVIQTCIEDQPFVFDTLMHLLASMELGQPRCIHPIVGVGRDADGRMERLNPLPQAQSGNESMMHFEVRLIEDPARLAEVERAVSRRMHKVQAMVSDFDALGARARWVASHLGEHLAESDEADYRHVTMIQRFFHWLVDDNFVFMGFGEYELGEEEPKPIADTGLGLNRLAHTPRGEELPFPRDAATWLQKPGLIYLGKGDQEAGIHRPGKIDQIAVHLRFGEQDRVLLFTGLYTYKAISTEVGRIPILREKLDLVLKSHIALEGSQLHRRLERAFHAIPVEFLFGADIEAIQGAIRLIMAADESQETGVHLLVDEANRSAFVILSLPRENYDDEMRQHASRRLMASMGANYMDYRLAFGPSGNVVLQFYLTAADRFSHEDAEEVERQVAAVTQTWHEQVVKLLRSSSADGPEIISRYLDLLPEEYQHQVDPAEAVDDLRALERVRETGTLLAEFAVRADDVVSGVSRLKIYQREKIDLTASTPVLGNFGLRVIDQTSVTITSAEGQAYYVDSFRVVPADRSIDLTEHQSRLVEGLTAVLKARAEDDGLNCLLISAGLGWHEVDVLRAYISYRRQLGSSVDIRTTYKTWTSHPTAARLLLGLFRARFNPALGPPNDRARTRLVQRNRDAFNEYLATVQTSSEDRILRRPLNLLLATLRTNFFSTAMRDDTPVAFKIDCAEVDEMVEPRPYREIFLFHDKVEGIHLRGGPVARGGLRWSDRPEDYRTEVLGLMDTQMVKNVLIVPVGAKGGFVLRDKYPTAAAARVAADTYYQVFIRGLLSLTDNVVDGKVVPPADVLRYDDDDPYLVVAADKGTAHLSDTANAISAEFGFWLGDAFASGGSAGYDHKKYAITAKGAWVCVRRHFREFGIDPELDPITVIGIGDMSGDVFGNGLLLSETVKLLGVFNHMHIFLDPSPDPEASWKERRRLFDLPRSSWMDYDKSLLSEGGGIFPRAAKAIPLSEQVQLMLGVETDSMTGDELIRALLRADADLLWNGGIGTYVKASSETDKDAGDSTNDAVRVDASELHFRVVGEGGNLGFTQAARVEYARNGGRINTDAVDNSGGVDMSDHEVNLKILAQDLEASGVLDRAGRDDLLLEIAGEVAAAVEANNHDHGQMLSLDVARSMDELEDFRVLIGDLETTRKLDRKRHQLPTDGEMLRRGKNNQGLLRPELCRIAPFVKMQVYETLLADETFYGPYVERWLMEYFPTRVRTQYRKYVLRHQLRKEIAATVITNRLVDAMGATHFSRTERLTGATYGQIALASLIAGDLLDVWSLKTHLRDVTGVRASVEYVLLRRTERSVARLARWLIGRGVDVSDPDGAVRRLKPGFEAYEDNLQRLMHATEKSAYGKQIRYMRNRLILRPENERAAGLRWIAEAGEAVLLAERQSGVDVVTAGRLLKVIAADLHLLTVSELATPEDARDGWESRAIARLRSDTVELVQRFAELALASGEPLFAETPSGKGARTTRGLERMVRRRWQDWMAPREAERERIDKLARRIQDAGSRGLAPALVLEATVRELAT